MSFNDWVDWVQGAIETSVALKIAGTIMIGGTPFAPVAGLLAYKMMREGGGKGKWGRPSPRQISWYAGELEHTHQFEMRKIRGQPYVRVPYVRIKGPSLKIEGPSLDIEL
jgi:hypothetical protein